VEGGGRKGEKEGRIGGGVEEEGGREGRKKNVYDDVNSRGKGSVKCTERRRQMEAAACGKAASPSFKFKFKFKFVLLTGTRAGSFSGLCLLLHFAALISLRLPLVLSPPFPSSLPPSLPPSLPRSFPPSFPPTISTVSTVRSDLQNR
jgi:hypothetical protein